MLITGTSDVSPNIEGFYDRNLLKEAQQANIHGRYAQIRPLPKNSGTRINFRRYGQLAVATTPLGDGVTPTGKKLTSTNIHAYVKQYGDFIYLSDFLLMTGLDSTLVEASEILGIQMGETDDTLTRDVLCTGTSVRYANGVANRSSIATALSANDVKAAIRILEGGNAKKITKRIVAGEKVGTRPVPPSSKCITHTDCRQNWEALPGFIKVEEFASQKNVTPETIGSYGNVMVEVTTNAKVYRSSGAAVGATGLISEDGSNIDVYTSIILGKDAYGKIPLQAGNTKNIIKKLGSGDDPINQRASSGWKMAVANKILNDEFLIRIEHGVTDL